MMHRKKKMPKVLISGASVAGPALAFWLIRKGFNVTLIERSAGLRTGGYKVDIRGAAVDVVKRMDLYEGVLTYHCAMHSAYFVNDKGRRVVELPADKLAMREPGDMELMRGDLSMLLYKRTFPDCNYIFNKSIQSVKENAATVGITFEDGIYEEFDLVIGADGIHSNVRQLVFGESLSFKHQLGDHYFAIFSVPNFLCLDREELFYLAPNRSVNIYSIDKRADAKVLLAFRCPSFVYDRGNVSALKKQVVEIYSGLRWVVPRLLEEIWDAPDFYCDAVQQVKMPRWSTGRVTLVGDAAFAPSWASGQGTSLALVGAYILATELTARANDLQTALPIYEQRMRYYVAKNQALGENVQQIVPHSRLGISAQLFKLKAMRYFPVGKNAVNTLQMAMKLASNAIELDPD